jgi:hypothetical protein
MLNANDIEQDLPHHFIADCVSIIIGASGDYHSTPSSVYPPPRQFINKIENSSNTEGSAGIEVSVNTEGIVFKMGCKRIPFHHGRSKSGLQRAEQGGRAYLDIPTHR